MAGHGRTSWDDVAVVTVSILRLVARCESKTVSPLRFRRNGEVVGVSEGIACMRLYAVLSARSREQCEARYRDDGGRLANALSVTDAGKAFLVGIE